MANSPAVPPRNPASNKTSDTIELSYQLIRNITSPDEKKTGVQSFIINLPMLEILKLGTRENLRSYLAEHNPKKRNSVHDAIRDTIDTVPERFITRNSGFVIGTESIEVDDNKKVVRMVKPSILNGAQSQGEIKQWVGDFYGDGLPTEGDPAFYVRAEIIVDPDADEVVETAIARNTATKVKSISQAGARGHLNDLEASIKKVRPEIQIQKSETDTGYDTRKVLQYTRLLMPSSVSESDTSAERLRAYKNPELCLSDFSNWYENRDRDPKAKAKYDFTVQMAPTAIAEYEYWEAHDAWNGKNLWEQTLKGGRACHRDKKTNRILRVSPGLTFPVLGAMSAFVTCDAKGKWSINRPKAFEPSELIANAVDQFRSLDSDPMRMGRDAGAYSALRYYTNTIVKILKSMGSSQP